MRKHTKSFSTIAIGLLVIACQQNTPSQKIQTNVKPTIQGTYRLLDLESQEDSVYKPKDQWISPAYIQKNKKVVNLAGGTYTFDGHQMLETLAYHSKDTVNIGHAATYQITLKGDTLYQSGIFKPGTPEEWKVEERWLKIE
ncbi:MAG: hypothetical protein RL711_15 [Bacteroidota bacterium]